MFIYKIREKSSGLFLTKSGKPTTNSGGTWCGIGQVSRHIRNTNHTDPNNLTKYNNTHSSDHEVVRFKLVEVESEKSMDFLLRRTLWFSEFVDIPKGTLKIFIDQDYRK